MTTTANHPDIDTHTSGLALSRVPAAFRLQFIVRNTFVLVPILVFLGTWLAAIGIGAWIHAFADGRDAAAEPMYGGVSQASLWVLFFMAAYSVTHTFPFAMALSFSRRVYVLGALLTFVVVSAGYGTAFIVAALIENATNGFGFHSYHFALPFLLDNGGYPGTWLLATAFALFLMLLGFLGASLYRRLSVLTFWTGAIVLFAAVAAIIVLLLQLVGWDSIWEFFGRLTTFSAAGWLLAGAVALALTSYAIVRRSTPGP